MSAAGGRRRRVWGLILAVAGVAGAAQALAAVQVPSPGLAGGPLWFGFVVLGFAVAEFAVMHVRVGRHAYAFSYSEIPLLVGLVFLTPQVLLLARLLGAIPAFAVWRRTSVVKVSFNLAWFTLETGVAVLVWHTVLGSDDPWSPRGWLATAVVVFTTSLLGSALVGTAIALDAGGRTRILQPFTVGTVLDLVNASVAAVVVGLLARDGRAAGLVVVIVVVLAVAYRSHERLRQRSDSLEKVNRFTAVVGSQPDVESVAASVVRQVQEAVGAEVVELLLRDVDGGGSRQWTVRADGPVESGAADTDGLATSVRPWLTAPLLAPKSARRGRDRPPVLCATGRKDLLAVPLSRESEPIGVLVAADRIGDLETFTKEHLVQLQALANHASIALDNTRRAHLLRAEAAEREHQALHDDLTGLPNRRLFNELLCASAGAAVLLLDLDRFKDINDTLGHHTGDRLLCLTAERIRAVVPPTATVARLGGDEFAVLLPDADETCALTTAAALRRALTQSFALDGLCIAVDASVGVALGDPNSDANTVVRWADVAMYEAKAARSGVEVYRPALDRHSTQRLTLLADLRDAVAAGDLTVVYQPKVNLDDGGVDGMEALCRWTHPRFGPVSPEEFIPVAEHSGLISELTLHVLTTALADCAAWRAAGRLLTVAVNVSPRSLLEPDFVRDVATVLAEATVPAEDLTLEITETSLMSEPDAAVARLRQLRELGVRLSIDDMGTGYSSLAYLLRLPVHEVKIDRSFLLSLPDPACEAVISAIIDLGHRLGRTVVAEGIEDRAAWHRLRELGCDTAQGYWVSRPLPTEAVGQWLALWSRTKPSPLRAVP